MRAAAPSDAAAYGLLQLELLLADTQRESDAADADAIHPAILLRIQPSFWLGNAGGAPGAAEDGGRSVGRYDYAAARDVRGPALLVSCAFRR
jgi:hypothetical protein